MTLTQRVEAESQYLHPRPEIMRWERFNGRDSRCLEGGSLFVVNLNRGARVSTAFVGLDSVSATS